MSIQFDEDDYMKLKKWCDAHDVSPTSKVRDLVKAFLEKVTP